MILCRSDLNSPIESQIVSCVVVVSSVDLLTYSCKNVRTWKENLFYFHSQGSVVTVAGEQLNVG